MSDEDDFTPRLGKQRSLGGGKRAQRYLATVVAATARSAENGAIRNRRFDGSRIGRGASMGRLLSSSDRLAAFRARRAVVKTRLVRLGTKGLQAARAHLRYIQRDGVTREGAPGQLYSAQRDYADGQAFLNRCDGDRHQFRFIVSAEDGHEYPDLKPYIRRLMTQMEADLATKLDWVAVDHFNTAHPHTHIMLRGVDDRGQNLIIAREYISHGIRERAAELATLDLGPRTDQEIEARLRHDIREERLTAIDRRLVRSMDEDRVVGSADRNPFQQSLRAGRLQKLASMGLAENIGGGNWQLGEDLEETLCRIGERGDIIRTMKRELTARKIERPWIGRSLFGAGESDPEPVVGRVIMRGLADEHNDRHYLLVDGVDGHAHYVDIGKGDAVDPIPEGAIIRVTARTPAIREADRVVAEVAAANSGRYSVDLHLRHDPSATQTFAEAHVRRLEAMRRSGAGVVRQPDGAWSIAADHVERAESYEARRHRDQPVQVETLSAVPLDHLRGADAATWLDRELASSDTLPIRDSGFGRQVRGALAARRQWLVEQQLAEGDGANLRLQSTAIALLQRRELLRVARQLSDELGKGFHEPRSGDRIEGCLVRRIDLVSGRFALIEKSREFTLVPWRPALERQLGKQVGGIIRSDGINWRFGRERTAPEIS
ncbi:relaxase/mobilization nuclease RlxS [Sphingomonas mali]|uniref:relaxase/mobilization nuclease RlxS n=1 Tax=Sphingomonas mali TaxID=40682 RepID=UPI0008326893|nr:relaxase/mobilization nuclease RlxS [Sphingomonas mali]